MTIKLEIPSDDYALAACFGEALSKYARCEGDVDRTDSKCVSKMHVKMHVDAADVTDAIKEVLTEQVESAALAPDLSEETTNSADPTDEADASRGQPVEAPVDDTPPPPPADTVSSTDAAGMPWDERIHSSNQTTNGNNTWKLRRKPKDMGKPEWEKYVTLVTNELLGIEAPVTQDETPSAPAAEPDPSVVFGDTPPPPVDNTPPPPVDNTPPPPVDNTPPPPVDNTPPPPVDNTPPPPAELTFAQVVKHLTGAPGDKRANSTRLNELLRGLGLDAEQPLPLLAKRPDLFQTVYDVITEEIYG